jgi:hypothetical protein
MHPIRIKPLKEVILVADDVSATRHLDKDVLGLEMPAAPDRLNLARVGTQDLGAAGPAVMAHPGVTGRRHLGLEVGATDFPRAVRSPAGAGDRGDGPGSAAGLPGTPRKLSAPTSWTPTPIWSSCGLPATSGVTFDRSTSPIARLRPAVVSESRRSGIPGAGAGLGRVRDPR